jgi:hypothetical protein
MPQRIIQQPDEVLIGPGQQSVRVVPCGFPGAKGEKGDPGDPGSGEGGSNETAFGMGIISVDAVDGTGNVFNVLGWVEEDWVSLLGPVTAEDFSSFMEMSIGTAAVNVLVATGDNKGIYTISSTTLTSPWASVDAIRFVSQIPGVGTVEAVNRPSPHSDWILVTPTFDDVNEAINEVSGNLDGVAAGLEQLSHIAALLEPTGDTVVPVTTRFVRVDLNTTGDIELEFTPPTSGNTQAWITAKNSSLTESRIVTIKSTGGPQLDELILPQTQQLLSIALGPDITSMLTMVNTPMEGAIIAAIDALVDAAPGTLDTINELADALGDDPNFVTTVMSAIGGKQSASAELDVLSTLSSTATGQAILQAASAAAARTILGLGTSAPLDVPVSGNAGTDEVVKGNDTRLTNTRTPTDESVTNAKVSDSAAIARKKLATPSTGLYVSGQLYGYPTTVLLGGSRTIAAGNALLVPMWFDGVTSYDGLSTLVTAGAVGGASHLYVIPADATTGRPNLTAPLAKISNIDTTINARRTTAFDSGVVLTNYPGDIVWFVIHSISGTATYQSLSASVQLPPPIQGATSTSSNGMSCISASGCGTSSTALATLAGITLATPDINQAPYIMWRKS